MVTFMGGCPSQKKVWVMMSKGPQGRQRPADVIGNAVHVARIAAGEIEETGYKQPDRVNPGRAGAKVRAESMTSEERSAVAKKAAAERRE